MHNSETARPNLTLENEIINYFAHQARSSNPQAIKFMPGQIKQILKEVTTLWFARGQLKVLRENEGSIQDSKNSIKELETYIQEKEASLKNIYYVEEIVGT